MNDKRQNKTNIVQWEWSEGVEWRDGYYYFVFLTLASRELWMDLKRKTSPMTLTNPIPAIKYLEAEEEALLEEEPLPPAVFSSWHMSRCCFRRFSLV
jgi:hypothetical protein